MVTIPTISEIRDQIMSDIESSLGQEIPILSKSVFRVLAIALAGGQYLLYKLGVWLYSQIFTTTMGDTALVARGAEYGMVRTSATIWKGTATATGDDDTVISAGTLWSYGDYAYSVIDEAIIADGEATMSLKSLEGGDDLTLAASSELSLTTPQTGLDSTATVASTTQSGEDQESLSDFRARILSRQKDAPQGGAIADFNGWAKEVSGIAEAYTFRPSAGYVNVYPLTDEDDPSDRIPSDDKLTEVGEYINGDDILPFGRVVSVLAFDELSFDIEISDLSPSTTSLQADIEEAIEDYLYERRPQQYEDDVDVVDTVSAAEITALIIAAGGNVATVDLMDSAGTSITSYELEYYELAVLGAVTWA